MPPATRSATQSATQSAKSSAGPAGVRTGLPVPQPLPMLGSRITLDSAAGGLGVWRAGQGRPLLLVHSMNAAASAAEMRPLHAHYSASRTVYSVDLPGFGGSQRGDRPYSPRLMTDALHVTLALMARDCGRAPVDALGLSLGCEFLVRAAAEVPARLRSLALVSPTGLAGGRALRGAPGSTRAMPWLLAALHGPGWGPALFRQLTKPAVVHYFLQRTWGSKAIDTQLWLDDVASAQAPGAMYAPFVFVSGGLFSADIHSVYDRVQCPVWLSHGVRGDFVDYKQQALLTSQPGNRLTVYPTGALPYFELTAQFCADYDAFLASVPASA